MQKLHSLASKFVVLAIIASLVCVGGSGQTPALTQPMPVDPQITMGTFTNGLRYYIRSNKKPEKRAELRLVVKAGSILEDDDQRGLAHFVEHMAFNGTKNFPKHELISFIESLGMRFGADINAYTSFDETVYMLQVPTDKPEAMDRAFQVLEDWARNVSFEPAEIEKERGVVLEEWRSGRGAGMRNAEKIFPVMFKGSRYANRLPIGTPEIIQNGKPERLKKFYEDWYRPDLMAIVAVGDFDKAVIEKLVNSHFASIPANRSPRSRPTYDVPDRADMGFAINTDKETTTTSVEIDTLLPARPEGSIGAYRQKTVDRLFAGMLNARFAELTQKPDAPFVFGFGGRGGFLARTKEIAYLNALVKEDGVERGLQALLMEAERVARFGFTETELARQKTNVLRSYERLALEKDNSLAASRADEYVRNFLINETLPSIDDEYALHQRFLPEIALAEINKLAREWFPVSNKNRLVIVTAPQKTGLTIPDETKLAAIIKDSAAAEIKPYVDTVASAVLLESLPAPGKIVNTTTDDKTGITVWQLANGVKVVLKPTTFRADEILFRASSPGGTSLVSDADYITASTATQVITSGGVAKFSAIELGKMLTGKVASATPFIGELEEGMSGSSSRRDLETMFQLIYLRFTQPRADANAFAAQATQARTFMNNQSATPGFAFVEALTSARYQNHPRRRLQTAATVDEWNLDKSLAFYKDRFADASDFTFYFVGNFDDATMKPLVERYLGALPSIKRKESWKDVGIKFPTGIVEKRVEKGIEPQSRAAIVFSGQFVFNQERRIALRAMSEILQTRLLELIREELGGTYSITAPFGYQKFPKQEYSITIQFGCSPERTDDLIKRVFEEIEKFKADGPTEKQLNDEKEALLREFETNSKQNGYLLNQIALRFTNEEDPAGLWLIPDLYRKLDAATIKDAAKLYLNTQSYVKVTLFPEKKAAAN
ncbi:MAG TPA: insulinase family protein [Pyrinomonadaceae bacterium]|jgi:zinc protease|nr:insulinase family protein [Pyrinomonadaceae bacterium]